MVVTNGKQMWRDELIDSHERLREIRRKLRDLCGVEQPAADDDILDRTHELHAIFRLCQRIYGTQGYGYGFIPFLIMRLQWFSSHGELPDYVLRAHEMMIESGISEDLKQFFRSSLEYDLPRTDIADVDEGQYQDAVGKLIASALRRRSGAYAL